MSNPRNARRYIVINGTRSKMYGYDQNGKLRMIFNLPWLRPFLFATQIDAYVTAQKLAGNVFEWPGEIYENAEDDNMLSR